MHRRHFLRAAVIGGTAFGIGSAWPRVFSGAAGGPGPYGPLGTADANGFQLPAGFSSRVVATTGQVVPGTSYAWHTAPDGGATFATGDGGWIYVSNSEAALGGAGMVRFSPAGAVVEARRILSGTVANCAGGADAVGHVALVRGARHRPGLGVRPDRCRRRRRSAGDGPLQARGGGRRSRAGRWCT